MRIQHWIWVVLFSFQLSAASALTKADIKWEDGYFVRLDKNGFSTSKGMKVIGSFSYKGDRSRSIGLRESIIYPLHPLILVRQGYTIYILDLEREKKIGQFNIPSTGTPHDVKIKPDQNGMTTLRTVFNILPSEDEMYTIDPVSGERIRKPFRPGPLIEQVLIYQNGEYIYKK